MLTEEAISEYANILVKGIFKNPALSKHRKHELVAIEQMRKVMIQNSRDVEVSLQRIHAWLHKWNVTADIDSLRRLELELESDVNAKHEKQ